MYFISNHLLHQVVYINPTVCALNGHCITFSVGGACNNFGQLLPQAGAGGDLACFGWADRSSVDARPERDDTLDGHLPAPQHPSLMDCYGTGIVGEEASVLWERTTMSVVICIRN